MDGRRASEGAHAAAPPPCYGERAERRRDIEWARPGTTWPPPLSKGPWHFATSQRIMKQHVGLRLYWRQGSCFASRRIVYCAAAALRPTAVSFRTGSSVRLVMYDIRISIKAFNTRGGSTFDAERADGAISVMQLQPWRHVPQIHWWITPEMSSSI